MTPRAGPQASLAITAAVLEENDVLVGGMEVSLCFHPHSASNSEKAHGRWFLIMVNDKAFIRHLSYNFLWSIYRLSMWQFEGKTMIQVFICLL